MSKPRKIVLLSILLLIVLGILTGIYMGKQGDLFWKSDLERLRTEEYNCVFLSMVPGDDTEEESFEYYRALPTVKVSGSFSGLKELSAFLEAGFLEEGFLAEREITHIYLVLDPSRIGSSYLNINSLYQKGIDKYLTPWFAAYPEITFEILLPGESLESWQSLSENERKERWEAYRTLTPILYNQSNTKVLYFGSEEWLVANSGNYESDNKCNYEVNRTLLLFGFRDDAYRITAENMEERFSHLESLLEKELPLEDKKAQTELSVVFFGDSVIGNYLGSLSIPGVVSSFTGGRVYNCGYGGISAARDEDTGISFPQVVDSFLSGEDSIPRDSQAYAGILAYQQDKHDKEEKLCFVINYGLNDYFEGYPVEGQDSDDVSSYCGALRLGIKKLKEAYPEAEIILMAPNFCVNFNWGTDQNSDVGGVLTDYVEGALSVAEEFSLLSIDNYHEIVITKDNYREYLVDDCHFNEWGRYLAGRKIAAKIKEIF